MLLAGSAVKELCGGEKETTNNRMELTAAMRALEALTSPARWNSTLTRSTSSGGSPSGLKDGRRAAGSERVGS